jgi:nitrogen-specific signal transduction histidine kinase
MNNEYIEVLFQDNAGGISEDIIDDIFEPFISNKLSHGIGIGLNVAKKILDEHEAIVEAKNKNNGALFIVKFKTSENNQ